MKKICSLILITILLLSGLVSAGLIKNESQSEKSVNTEYCINCFYGTGLDTYNVSF